MAGFAPEPATTGDDDGYGVQVVASRGSQSWTVQFWKMFAVDLRVNPSEALVTTWAVSMEMS